MMADTMTTPPPTTPATTAGADLGDPTPVVLATGERDGQERPVRPRRILLQVGLGALVVLIVVGVVGVFAARRLAEAEAVTDAAKTADLLDQLVVQPAITDPLLTGNAAALSALDAVVRDHLLDQNSVVRVKLWDADGMILYSDEPRLIGQRFELGEDERGVFTDPQIRAEVTDLNAPENLYERDAGKLLETYRPVWTPSGTPLLFEIYFRYDQVIARSGEILRGFAGITLSSLLLTIVLLVPILWRLLSRLRRAQSQRERLLQRALDASGAERRRIAGSLHDGVVQELVGTSLAISGAAEKAAADGRPELAGELREAAGTVRTSIGGLRSLLVEIYPPSLAAAGLDAALTDLATPLRARGVDVLITVPHPSGLDGDGDRLVFRICQEALTNVLRHAEASEVRIELRRGRAGHVLEIVDDGRGFDPAQVLAQPEEGHFGLRVLADVAAAAGARLTVASAPGAGTRWMLETGA
jgi:two-component system, NarL family, sensor kinase